MRGRGAASVAVRPCPPEEVRRGAKLRLGQQLEWCLLSRAEVPPPWRG